MISEYNRIKLEINTINIARKSHMFKRKQHISITLESRKKSQGKLENI